MSARLETGPRRAWVEAAEGSFCGAAAGSGEGRHHKAKPRLPDALGRDDALPLLLLGEAAKRLQVPERRALILHANQLGAWGRIHGWIERGKRASQEGSGHLRQESGGECTPGRAARLASAAGRLRRALCAGGKGYLVVACRRTVLPGRLPVGPVLKDRQCAIQLVALVKDAQEAARRWVSGGRLEPSGA